MTKNEVVEVGVTRITVDRGGFIRKDYVPAGQQVKWFVDELGERWIKFDLAPEGVQQKVVTIVIPAWRVVEVQYEK